MGHRGAGGLFGDLAQRIDISPNLLGGLTPERGGIRQCLQRRRIVGPGRCGGQRLGSSFVKDFTIAGDCTIAGAAVRRFAARIIDLCVRGPFAATALQKLLHVLGVGSPGTELEFAL